jgi:hypothetical protein
MARISTRSAARVRRPCRIEERSEKMIANMALANYSSVGSNSTGSTRTEFLVGTSSARCCGWLAIEQESDYGRR